MEDIFKFSTPTAPDQDELCAFVDRLDEIGSPPPTYADSTTAVKGEKSQEILEDEEKDIWEVMSHAFDRWLERIIDVESRLNTDHSFKKHRIDQAIQRMLEDGLIGICDANELRFVGDSWLRLLNAYSCSSVGCRTYKQDVVSALLDLFSARQITKSIFVKICEKL